ncbi:MAG: dihydrolipoamide acetyltransferase family protein [Bacteroidota bacterium]
MAQVELVMPKMGESIMEATIIKWVKKVGDAVEADETILEIATDKVDSEVPSPVSGKVTKILFEEEDTVEIGQVIAVIATEGQESMPEAAKSETTSNGQHSDEEEIADVAELLSNSIKEEVEKVAKPSVSERFYSPLVRNIAQKENISLEELDQIVGTGLNDRVTKKDILAYIKNKSDAPQTSAVTDNLGPASDEIVTTPPKVIHSSPISTSVSGATEIVEMDRMRRLIADHMVLSKKTSPHVTSFVEVDVTEIVNWRNKVKADYQRKYGEKITYTPIFIEAIAKAIKDFPMVNVSVDGYKIIVKKDINIGMATALPSNNLIVPVIKNADYLNLVGLSKQVNDLANRARQNQLKPSDTQGGTFTMTNVGTFGNTMGVPIINQPQAAILAVGGIKKKPAVLETKFGDVIAVRHLMFLSLSYDHRVIDGMLGGSFLRKIGDYLESFDATQSI